MRHKTLFALWLALLGPATANAQNEPFLLATHMETAVPDDEMRLRPMLIGQAPFWEDGSTVQLVLPPRGSPEMTWLCEEVLGMPENTYRRYLMEKVFRGSIPSPIQAEEPDDVARLLAEEPGRIAPLPLGVITEDLRPVDWGS